jgi:xanthine dehydrogenase accessory factor
MPYLASQVKPQTRQWYLRLFRQHIAATLGAVRLKDVKQHHVAAVLATAEQRGLSANSRRHEQHRALDYGDHSVFIETLAPPPDLLVFGAVHIGQALTSFGTQMGFRVTVVDSRAPFVTDERFPSAHRLLVGWPRDLMDQLTFDRRTWVVVLSHDPRHETPPLEAALKADTRYIGAMGSRRTHGLRVERLRELGFADEDIERIHSPVGLDIGAETPQEVAVSILAEMTMVRYGAGSGISLKGVEGRVHKQRGDE